jgi:hypothetical protein
MAITHYALFGCRLVFSYLGKLWNLIKKQKVFLLLNNKQLTKHENTQLGPKSVKCVISVIAL